METVELKPVGAEEFFPKETAERSPVERGVMPAEVKKGDDKHKFERLKIISRATTTLIFAMFSLWIVFKLITFLFARCP